MKTKNASSGRFERVRQCGKSYSELSNAIGEINKMSLKEKIRHELDNNGELIESFIDYEDIKEAVLKFEQELNADLMYLMQDEDICMDAHGLDKLIKKYKKIFGDFKNE